MLWHQTDNSLGNYRSDTRIYKGVSYRTHFHKNYELLYVIAGNCHITVGQHGWDLETGQLFLVPPYAVHGFTCREDTVLWVCVFSADHISGFSLSDRLFSPFRCDPETGAFLQTHLFVLPEAPRLVLQGCLYLVCDQCRRNATQEAQWDFDRILQITQIVSDHLDQELDLAFVAQTLNYEYHYFSRLFHSLFGMNFRKFVNLYRIEQACQMLQQTDLSISQIALDCGFRTVRSFNRAFLAHTGCAPSQYRTKKP